MKKNVFFRTLFILFVIGFVSCEQDTNVEPPKYIKKPNINCFLCPESSDIFAELKFTKPYFGVQTNGDEYILDAHVSLIDLTDPDTSELILQNGSGIYKTTQTEIKIVENHHYLLVVKLSTGKVYYAESIVPPKLDMSKFYVSYLKVGTPILDSSGRGPGGPGGPGVVYERNPFTLEYYYTGYLNKKFYINPQFEAVMENSNGQFLPVEIVSRGDNEFYGVNSEGKIRVYSNRDFNSGFGLNGPWNVNEISGYVYTVDESYKNFYVSQNNDLSDGFFSEPTIMISNWSEGAIGFFGSYNFVSGVIYKK